MIPIAIFFLAAGVVSAQPVEYRLEPGNGNKISLEIGKTGLLRGKKHQMELHRFQGKLLYDSQTPANSKVDLKIAAASITVNDTWLKPSDQKKVLDYAVNDMLAVKQYPDIRFVSTKVTPKGGNQFMIEGTLTIRGNGKPAVLNATLDAAGPVINGTSIVKMTDYGLKPPSAALGAIGTRNEMEVMFRVSGTK